MSYAIRREMHSNRCVFNRERLHILGGHRSYEMKVHMHATEKIPDVSFYL